MQWRDSIQPRHESTHVPTKGQIREAHADFPWEELFARMGEPLPQVSDRDYAAMGLALRRILLWMTRPTPSSRDHLQTVGKRVLAMAWRVDRSILDGSPSLRLLAKQLNLQVGDLHRHTLYAKREFEGRRKSP